jgi:uncharacterized protein (TIGR00369 family)
MSMRYDCALARCHAGGFASLDEPMTQDNSGTEPASETNLGVTPLEELRKISGLEFLRAMLAGRYPHAPITATLGFRLAEVDPGRVVFTGTPQLKHYNPIGTVHAGYAATLLDSCMACAVHTHLRPGQGYTTVEFKINLVRPMTAETGKVRAEGRTVNVGRQLATAEGYLYDAAGKLLAHGTTTCIILGGKA